MNWSVLKDKKWLVFQSISILLAFFGVIQAVNQMETWLLCILASMFFMIISVNGAAKVMVGDR